MTAPRRASLASLAALALLAGSAPPARAAGMTKSARGTSAAAFLKLGPGARAAAMGEAFTAVADDASAVFWNPAGLARVKGRSAVLMHAPHIDDSAFDFGGFAASLGRFGAAGAAVHYFTAGAVDRTDDTGTTLGSFAPNDLAVSGAWAYEVKDQEFFTDLNGFCVGAAAKHVRSELLAQSRTWAVDFGAVSPAYLGGDLRVAFAALNFGGRLKFEDKLEDLPSSLKAGAAARMTDSWLAAADLVLPSDNAPYAALGTEAVWRFQSGWNIAGRLGMNTRALNELPGFHAASAGMGVGARRFSFDYAVVPFGPVGISHRVSVTFGF